MDYVRYPEGYKPVLEGDYQGQHISEFGAKETRVTNDEWYQVVSKLGADRYILLKIDKNTHVVSIVRKGKTAKMAAGDDVSLSNQAVPVLNDNTNYDIGEVMRQGVFVLLKMADNPSVQYDRTARYDSPKRKFSGENQPAVGMSWYAAWAWCLLKTEQDGEGKFAYKLFTDLQYEWMVSDGGKRDLEKTYPTPNRKLYAHSFPWDWGKQCAVGLLHGGESATVDAKDPRNFARLVKEVADRESATVDVKDPRNAAGPFGVRTCGDAHTWTDYNPKEKNENYGLRGGAWSSVEEDGRAAFRHFAGPHCRGSEIGFSPVVVRYKEIK